MPEVPYHFAEFAVESVALPGTNAAHRMTNHVDAYHKAEADRYEHLQRAREATDRKAAALRAMHENGQTWVDIADALGVTPQRVQQLARRP